MEEDLLGDPADSHVVFEGGCGWVGVGACVCVSVCKRGCVPGFVCAWFSGVCVCACRCVSVGGWLFCVCGWVCAWAYVRDCVCAGVLGSL